MGLHQWDVSYHELRGLVIFLPIGSKVGIILKSMVSVAYWEEVLPSGAWGNCNISV